MAEEIKRDKDIIKTQPVLLDPIFELPPDLDEGGYRLRDSGDNSGDVYEASVLLDPDQKPDATPTDSAPTGGRLPDGRLDPSIALNPFPPFRPTLDPRPLGAPVDITVKSQTLRFNADGTYVVDVILEFPDQEGATSYEVRLAQ